MEHAGHGERYPNVTTTVRCLLLLWTGDDPAQSEIVKRIFGGKYPCRRCKLQGEIN